MTTSFGEYFDNQRIRLEKAMQNKNTGQEHTGSYYAASRNNPVEYPELQGDLETEICIIGGGFTGVATALTLAERGHRVVILEQNRIGWGAPGRT